MLKKSISIFRVSFKMKLRKNAVETGMMCSLAVVASLLLCFTRRIVFKETKLVGLMHQAWDCRRTDTKGELFERQLPFRLPFVSARHARFFSLVQGQ